METCALEYVKGPGFNTFHELFDKVSDDVEDYIELIAERAVQVGGVADSTKRGGDVVTFLRKYLTSPRVRANFTLTINLLDCYVSIRRSPTVWLMVIVLTPPSVQLQPYCCQRLFVFKNWRSGVGVRLNLNPDCNVGLTEVVGHYDIAATLIHLHNE